MPHASRWRPVLMDNLLCFDDDRVRERVRAFNMGLTRLSISRDRDEARAMMLAAVDDYAALQQEVGEVFRALQAGAGGRLSCATGVPAA